MVKSPLVEMLNSFSGEESRRFFEYISSPFFNKNEKVVMLYTRIRKAAGNPAKLEREYLYKKVTKEKSYNSSSMGSLIFALTRLAEDYLGYISYTSRNDREINIVKELNKRQLDRSLEKKLKSVEEQLENVENRDAEYFYNMYLFSLEKMIYGMRSSRYLTIKDKQGQEITKFNNYLIVFFARRIIYNYLFFVNKSDIVALPLSLKTLEEIIKNIKENLPEGMPELAFNFKLLKLVLEGKEEDYFELKKIINGLSAETEYLMNILITLENFCVTKIHEGDEKFIREAFDITNLMLKFKVHAHEGKYIRPVQFKNFVITALKLKEYNWAEKFIEDYKEQLAPEKRENAYNFCLSKLYFARGDFKRSLEYLSRVQNEDVYYKLEIKQSLLKIYYELGMYKESVDLCDTYRHFFADNQFITDDFTEAAQSFVKFTMRLLKAKVAGDKNGVKNIVEEITNTPVLFGRDWLKEKAEELGS